MSHNFRMLSDTALIFHICTFSLIPRSSVNVKVKYQGHTLLKNKNVVLLLHGQLS